MMHIWMKNIFVNAIKARMNQETRTADDIIQEYTKLTTSEKTDILKSILG